MGFWEKVKSFFSKFGSILKICLSKTVNFISMVFNKTVQYLKTMSFKSKIIALLCIVIVVCIINISLFFKPLLEYRVPTIDKYSWGLDYKKIQHSLIASGSIFMYVSFITYAYLIFVFAYSAIRIKFLKKTIEPGKYSLGIIAPIAHIVAIIFFYISINNDLQEQIQAINNKLQGLITVNTDKCYCALLPDAIISIILSVVFSIITLLIAYLANNVKYYEEMEKITNKHNDDDSKIIITNTTQTNNINEGEINNAKENIN